MSETLAEAEANEGPIPPSHPWPTFGRWVENVLIAIDELGNAIIGGSPHETISSRAYRARTRGSFGACVLCKFLNVLFLSKDHCKAAYDEMSARDY